MDRLAITGSGVGDVCAVCRTVTGCTAVPLQGLDIVCNNSNKRSKDLDHLLDESNSEHGSHEVHANNSYLYKVNQIIRFREPLIPVYNDQAVGPKVSVQFLVSTLQICQCQFEATCCVFENNIFNTKLKSCLI